MTRGTIALLAAAGLAAPAMANHVDFITDGEFNLEDDGSTVVSGSPDNILGGLRSVSLSGGDDASASFDSVNSYIQFDADDASNLTLDYGDFAGGNGELNADFQTDWNFIAVEFSDVNGSGTLGLDIESTAGNASVTGPIVDGAGTYYFAFDDAGFGSVDFGDVDRISLRLDSTEDASFQIESVTRETVPAPGALAALGLGGLAMGRRRR